VRVEGDDAGDQVRIMSPKDAISAGADFVVIGRSITSMWNGSDTMMRKKIEQIASTLG
jgi:orotidine-5'-phosphate decarboxylase